MKSHEAKDEFEKLLFAQDDHAFPLVMVNTMLRFYNSVRVDDCILENEGDMLLFQWGTYDWGQGRWFRLNITRQIIPQHAEDDDDEIFQLSATAKFHPSAELDALGFGNQWCSSLDELADFFAFIATTAAIQRLHTEPCAEVEIEYSCAG